MKTNETVKCKKYVIMDENGNKIDEVDEFQLNNLKKSRKLKKGVIIGAIAAGTVIVGGAACWIVGKLHVSPKTVATVAEAAAPVVETVI